MFETLLLMKFIFYQILIELLIGHLKIDTQSSARGLRRAGVNLLAGRALTYYFHPLTSEELAERFSLEKSLKFGHLPMVYNTQDPKKFLNSYIQAYLKEEIQQEGLTRNLGDFSRFLETASFSQGEVLNISQVAKEAMLERKTVENYFKILEGLLIAERLPVFNKRAKRKLISHNKFYFFDTGVFRALRPSGPLDSDEEIDGPALETLFLQELRALNDYYDLDFKIYYWRSVAKLEVDFVLYGPKIFRAIEIKRKSVITDNDLRGLRAFSADYPEAKCYLFCTAKNIEYRGNITIIPIKKAFSNWEKFFDYSS